jgi:hypothetical protein
LQDRTPQLTALAQLLLDPFYRTPRGLATLIHREFASFGHRLALRRALGQPIFLQFVDAVWQLQRQCPHAFGFGEVCGHLMATEWALMSP